jgi:hypothetical protein
MQNSRRHETNLDADLFVYTLLLVFDLFFDLLQGRRIWSRAVCFQYLNIAIQVRIDPLEWMVVLLIRERCNLLFGLFIVCEFLLVLLPVLARGAGHVVEGAGSK